MNEPCDCCEGIHQSTPARIVNRPGLRSLAYRVGTHATFLETMKARLSSYFIDVPKIGEAGQPTTERLYPFQGATTGQGLTTRASNDPSIALLDAWATVGDVLTFYQERIANEGYLQTATERRSILELARLVGYALRPGVASTVYLAYTIDPNFKAEVVIPVGARTQSVPGPGELPQCFETADALSTRAAWNLLRPRIRRPQTGETILDRGSDVPQPRIYLKGLSTNLKPNDPLLIQFHTGEDPVLYRIMDVKPEPAFDRTLVTFQDWIVVDQVRMQVLRIAETVGQIGDTSELSRRSANSEIVKRVKKHLGELQRQIEADTGSETLIALVKDDILPRLMEELTVAEDDPKFTKLRPWLRRVVDEVNAAATNLSEAELRSQPVAVRRRGEAIHLKDPLLAALPKLTLAASVPPRNTLRLERKLATLFAERADTGLQILGTFRSELREAAPKALSNAKVTQNNLIKAYALRVKAAPFGHNAPLKPIPDRSGRVIGSEEWPLAGVQTFVAQTANLNPGGTMSLTLRNSRESVARTVVIPSDGNPLDVQLASTAVKLTSEYALVEGDDVPVFTSLTLEAPSLDYKLTLTPQSNLSITVTTQIGNASDIKNVTPGRTISDQVQGHKMTISFLGGNLAVMDESPMPPSPKNVVDLDTTYDAITPGSWVVILRADSSNKEPLLTQANAVENLSRADYGITGKVTRLTLGDPWLTDNDRLLTVVRGTTVLAQSEAFDLAEEPITTDLCDGEAEEIELDDLYTDLQSGRWLIISGERTDVRTPDPDEPEQTVVIPGIRASELLMLAQVRQDVKVIEDGKPLPGDKTHTFIKLAEKLAYCYKRDTVMIYGNVVKATHGETRNETLGNGNASQAFQSFTLKQPPLTYVPTSNPRGVESTLHVRVNDVEWHEVENLGWLEPTDRNFITRTSDDDKTTVIFGNGLQGARLPTGVENVKAVYRNGIGKAGNVKAEQISLLVTRPLGVKEVINPLRASGGADKETRDQARKNAPLAVLALDRLVSTQDYADFTRMFAGIGKASATRMSDGYQEFIHVTIAGSDDIPIDKTSDLYQNLVKALQDFGDPYQPFQVELRELIMIVISANVRLLPDYLWESVATKIRTKLLETFSFEKSELGQDLVLSEVISVIQSVEGVAFVDVDTLGGISEKDDSGAIRTPQEIVTYIQELVDDSEKHGPMPRIPVGLAAPGHSAQLAFLSPDVDGTLILNEVKP